MYFGKYASHIIQIQYILTKIWVLKGPEMVTGIIFKCPNKKTVQLSVQE